MKRFTLIIIAGIIASSLLAQVEKKVIIEHFTNTKCSTCAAKNPALYETLEDYPQVMHVAYHPSSPYSSCIFSQHNPSENDARTNYYGVYGATPRAVIQGEALQLQTPMVKVSDIDSRLGLTSDFKVMIINDQVNGDDYKVNIDIERVSGNDSEEVLVYVALAEEEIQYSAPNGENMHHNVFRKMLYNESMTISVTGGNQMIELDYSMHPEWTTDEIYAYIIINDNQTKEVLQSEASLTSTSAIIANRITEVKNVLYPNPGSTTIQIIPEYSDYKNVQLFSLVGTMVKQFQAGNSIDVSYLPEGMYFVKITDNQNNQFSTRFIKSQ